MNNPLKAATVGTFDGVHKGHAAVIDTLLEESRNRGLSPMVVTFDRHPLREIAPERAPGLLTSINAKEQLLRGFGVTPLIVPFDSTLRHTSAYSWMSSLYRRHGVRLLIVGYDNTFGCDGLQMDISDYMAMGDEIGITVIEAPTVEGISSSAIRKAVRSGDISRANEMLGHPFMLEGSVVHGAANGRKIGFPTANLDIDEEMVIPANGVYSATAILPDGSRRPAMVNIGVRPTVGDLTEPLVEVHIPGWEGNLYGKTLKIEFLSYIRPEQKFDSFEHLRAQIAKDVEMVGSGR